MHRCLLIPEILRIICVHISSHHQSCDLHGVVLVCRSFYNASLDLLWRDIAGLFPLLRTLPSDIWSGPLSPHEVVLARAITPSDLERFKAHAHHVQVYSDHYIDVPIAIYQALSFHFHDQPILPNLVEMVWTDEEQEIFPYISMFLAPCIRKMELGMSNSSVQNSLLSTLGMKCPSMTHFELDAMDYYPDMGRQVESLLSQWHQLETLIIHGLPQESLRIVAALPHLRNLTIFNADNYSDAFSPTPGTNVFPALQDLLITANSAILPINLLRATTSCSLKKFTLSLFGLASPGWHDLFTTLAESCNKATLTTIRINESEVDHEQGPGTTDELRLLFPFTNLTHLILETCVGFDIDDAFVHEMAAAWSCIHTLNIGATEIPQPSEPRKLTLQGLAPLAELCPNLRKLTVHVNVAHMCSNHFDVCSTSKSRVEHLNVGYSPVSQTSVPWAAAYLSAIFPKLRELDYSNDYRGRERSANPDRWLDVHHHLVAYRHVSGHRRNDSHCSNCRLYAM
ncbi:hypothetical protein BD779DRAFT_534420 [Infundibulicybe gibba]|nr:hypothetical protein BD779DRAFT_534420 [Infundibulicybe gibba]